MRRPGELSKILSIADAAKLSDNYTLLKGNNDDPFYEFVSTCGGYSCNDGNDFTTSAFTKYEKFRGIDLSYLDLIGLGLDVFGLITAGSGDELIKIGGRVIGSPQEVGQWIGGVDVAYGVTQQPDPGLVTDIAGLFLSGPYGMAMDGLGIMINVGGTIRYGP